MRGCMCPWCVGITIRQTGGHAGFVQVLAVISHSPNFSSLAKSAEMVNFQPVQPEHRRTDL